MTTPIDLHSAEAIPSEAHQEIEGLLTSGDLFRYTSGTESPVARLEEIFAEALGVKYALAVSSCSAALFLSMRALDLKPGARVLIPAFTFAAVPSSVIHAGCKPVLVDVGSNYRIDLEHFYTKLAEGADAVLISHMRGHTSDMDVIETACAAEGIPLIEDAAHSLGTLWGERRVGTIGRIGCFSFQSYKMLNAGEGGMMITDDADLFARAVIMSGAYEHNWKKHRLIGDRFEHWQNQLPLYNLRMNNLAAAVLCPQVPLLDERCTRGRENHDYVAAILNASPFLEVPPPLAKERRAPDSIQFNLHGCEDDAQVDAFVAEAAARGVDVQVFGLKKDNARAFWNWQFLGHTGELPKTRQMLMRACDVRMPTALERPVLDQIAAALTESAAIATTRSEAA